MFTPDDNSVWALGPKVVQCRGKYEVCSELNYSAARWRLWVLVRAGWLLQVVSCMLFLT